MAVHGACARAHTVSRPPQYPRRGRSRITVTNCSVQKSLQELGWTDGSIRIEARWAGGDVERLRKHSKELVALGPDVILTSGSVTVRPLQQATRTIPIVFVQAVDPVGSGYVESMSRPGGNTTGFTQFEYSLSGKWLELLKQIAPQVTRVAVVRDPVNGSGIASSP
ncbi:MAG: ABC transporter substrate binding protein [Pseudolabrys sp.]